MARQKHNEFLLSEAEEDLAVANQKDDGLELSVAIAGMGGKLHKSRNSCRYSRYGS